MKRAIITGATGAIGTALLKEFIACGTEVLVLTRKDSARNGVIPVHPLIQVAYCGLEELCSLQNDTGRQYDAFYHFAWAGTFGDSRNDMILQTQNIRYALDALNAAARFGCKVFVGAGSQAEYGRVEGVLKPLTPAFPENGYGMAKLCAGQMTREAARKLGVRHIWARVLSVYGPNDGANSMISSTIRKMKAGETAQFTKGEQLWDYLYSGDAAQAFRLLGERGKDGKVYVLGSGNAIPLREYIMQIRNAIDPTLPIGLGMLPYAEKQVMHLCADIGELTEDTGWKPKVKFEDGIKNILNDYMTDNR